MERQNETEMANEESNISMSTGAENSNTNLNESPQIEAKSNNESPAPATTLETAEVKTSAETIEMKSEGSVDNNSVAPVSNPVNEATIDIENIPVILEHEEHNEEKSEEISEEISFENLKRPELIAKLSEISSENDLLSRKKEIKALRDAFVALSKEEFNAMRDAYIAKNVENEDGTLEPFVAPEDPLRDKYKEIAEKINAKIQQQIKDKEKQLIKNLNDKKEIIEQIKAIVDNPVFNFSELNKIHELQAKWRGIGFVPNSDTNNLWESYKFHINRFYDRLARDKELKELDHKKNLHEKKLLCEKAEELILEPSIKTAIDRAKALQKHWKEVGGVSREDNDLIWERFNTAIDTVYARQKVFIDSLREQQKENFIKKSELLSLMEEVSSSMATNHKEWQELSEKSDAIMETWKQIGFASKEQNEEIWKKFKDLRDGFYKRKEEFYDQLRQMLSHNLKLKQDMCEQVENLTNSTDWRNTSNTIKKIQEQWKTVGPVSKKHSEKIWARFRKACDTFFENKKLNFADEELQQQKNLEAKNELIAKIENFQLLENNNDTIQELKKFQSEWMGIGHIPFKQKEEVNNRYKKAIDKQFELVRAKVGDQHKSLFQMRYQEIGNSGKGVEKLKDEKQKLREKITKINTEIAQFENNIGFFAKSKGADAILKDVRAKIEASKREIVKIKEQMKMLDEMIQPPAPKKEVEKNPEETSQAE